MYGKECNMVEVGYRNKMLCWKNNRAISKLRKKYLIYQGRKRKMGNQIKKSVTKVVGVIMLIAVLFTSVGQEAQAAKQIKWPYGTYVATGKQVQKVFGLKKIYLSWEYITEPTAKYPELIRIYTPGNYEHADEFVFRKIGTNKYRSKKITSKKHYLTLKVTKKKVIIKEKGFDYFMNHIVSEGPYNLTFKLKKRLSKNVG